MTRLNRVGASGLATLSTAKPAAARSVVLSMLTHDQWLNKVIEWCHQGSWLCTAMHDSRRQHWSTHTGFPDVFAVRGGRAIAAELKTGSGRARADQRTWLLELQAAGIRTFVWYPSDADEVRAVLLEGVPLSTQVRRASMRKSVKKVRPRSARSTPRGPTIRP